MTARTAAVTVVAAAAVIVGAIPFTHDQWRHRRRRVLRATRQVSAQEGAGDGSTPSLGGTRWCMSCGTVRIDAARLECAGCQAEGWVT